MLSLNNTNAFVALENNSFLINSNPYSQPQIPFLDTVANTRSGGGLVVIVGSYSSNNTILIMSCGFENNSALYGAGLAVVVTTGATSNKVVVSQNSQFTFNSATLAGGGVLVVLDSTQNNSVTISASFVRNSASIGGGLSCITSFSQMNPAQSNSLTLTQSCFLANVANRGGSAISMVTSSRSSGGYPIMASMDQCNITKNTISALSSPSSSSVVGLGAVYLELSSLSIHNVLFNQNAGTALFLMSSSVKLQGNVVFAYNYAINGAGVYIVGTSWLNLTKGLQLQFEGNYALQYGGGVYQEFPLPGAFGEWWDCFMQYENISIPIQNWSINVSFLNNTAQSGGSSIYLSNPESCVRDEDDPPFTNSLVYNYLGSSAAQQVSSPPSKLLINQSSTTLWEGQMPQLFAFASGYFNSSIVSTRNSGS